MSVPLVEAAAPAVTPPAREWVATLLSCERLPLAVQPILPPHSAREQCWVEFLLRPQLRCGQGADNERLWQAAARAGAEAGLDARVLADALRWLADNPWVDLATINLTAPSLHAGFAEDLLELCRRRRVGPNRICLELSERTPIPPDREALDELERLADAGIALALDDFGAHHGATHLGLLAQVPMHLLKIDLALTQAAARAGAGKCQARRVLDSLVGFAGALGMVPVLEGVESTHELALRGEYRIAAWQGYAIGRPRAIH